MSIVDVMGSPNRPVGPRRGRSSILIIGIAIAIVAIAAVAGAFVLLSQAPDDENNGVDTSNNDGSDGNDSSGTDNDSISIDQYDLKQGDYVEFDATSSVLGLTQTATVRLTVTGVTSSGYDITLSIRSGSGEQLSTFHANSTEDLIAGVAGDAFSRGERIGEEIISTVYGDKQVEHWRSTTVSGGTTNVTDYYVGKSTGMVYKAVIGSTSDDILNLTTTTNLALSDTNIGMVKNGDMA